MFFLSLVLNTKWSEGEGKHDECDEGITLDSADPGGGWPSCESSLTVIKRNGAVRGMTARWQATEKKGMPPDLFRNISVRQLYLVDAKWF